MARKFFSKEDRERYLRQRQIPSVPERCVPTFISTGKYEDVIGYLGSRERELSEAGQRALIRRQDLDEVDFYFYLEKFGHFSETVMAQVFAEASKEIQLLVLEKVEDSSFYRLVDVNKVLHEADLEVLKKLVPRLVLLPEHEIPILERQDVALLKASGICDVLSKEAQIWFVQHGSFEMFRSWLNTTVRDHPLCRQAEQALIDRGDDKLIELYFETCGVDAELMKQWQDHGTI